MTIYTPEWQAGRANELPAAFKTLHAIWAHFGLPRSMADVGCGLGHLCQHADRVGVHAVGMDISLPDTPQRLHNGGCLCKTDLTQPFGGSPVEHVLCWEVAEHLPATAADNLCRGLAELTGEWLFFTAAPPGQGGYGHINEQPQEYWIDKLEATGLQWDPRCQITLKTTLNEALKTCRWYAKNMMVFRR